MISYMSPNPHLVRPDRETFIRLTAEMNDRQISRLFGCTSPVIAKWRDFYGIPRSPRQSGGNTAKWQTNRDYFSQIDTPEKAYILGFLIADGHINRTGYKVEVSVKEADADLLRSIAGELRCDAPLRTMINSYDASRMVRLNLCGKSLISDLNNLGLYHDKSTTAVWPAIPPELEGHLARGIWDGDGHIGRTEFNLIGTPAILDGIMAAAERHTGCVLRHRLGGRDRRYHYAYGTRRDTAVLHWMYSDATIVLQRKREKFLTYWSVIPRTESLNLRIGSRVYTRRSQVRSAADYPSAG
jgi:hypothetical protein